MSVRFGIVGYTYTGKQGNRYYLFPCLLDTSINCIAIATPEAIYGGEARFSQLIKVPGKRLADLHTVPRAEDALAFDGGLRAKFGEVGRPEGIPIFTGVGSKRLGAVFFPFLLNTGIVTGNVVGVEEDSARFEQGGDLGIESSQLFRGEPMQGGSRDYGIHFLLGQSAHPIGLAQIGPGYLPPLAVHAQALFGQLEQGGIHVYADGAAARDGFEQSRHHAARAAAKIED